MIRPRGGKPSQGGRGSQGGGRMRFRWNGVPSLVNAPDCLRKSAKACRDRSVSPSKVGEGRAHQIRDGGGENMHWGEGTWKQVGTCQEHCKDWNTLFDMFPAGTFVHILNVMLPCTCSIPTRNISYTFGM